MNTAEALQWIENASGLTILISKNKTVTLTDGSTFEVYGTGITDAVNKLQEVLKTIQAEDETIKICSA